MYVLVVNRTKRDIEPGELSKVISRHMAWIKERIQSGSVIQAGKWGAIGGVCVLRTESIEDADRIVQDDPLVRSGFVTYEMDEFFPVREIS